MAPKSSSIRTAFVIVVMACWLMFVAPAGAISLISNMPLSNNNASDSFGLGSGTVSSKTAGFAMPAEGYTLAP